MENKDEIIKALCTMYGAGYRGPVKYVSGDGKNIYQVTNDLDFGVIDQLNNPPKGWKYSDIHIPPNPFTDLLTKDESGVCDAERLAFIFMGKGSYVEVANGTYIIIRDVTSEYRLTIQFNHDMNADECYDMDAGVWEAMDVQWHEITDFMRSKGYLIPDALKGGEG